MIRAGTAALAAWGMVAAAAPALAQTGWGIIGAGVADPQATAGTIAPRTTDPVREFMFCVEDAAVRFRGVTIRFADGAPQQVGFRDRLAAGRCGRALGVQARGRAIAGIDFTYDPAVLAGNSARVQAFGR